jgi:tetratricopeptide (TPR) repeat protein
MAETSIPNPEEPGRHLSGPRVWSKRLGLAAAAPVAFLLLLEGTLRLTGFGTSTDLFIPDSEPGYVRTNPHFTDPFIPHAFGIGPLNFRIQRHKDPNQLRIFVLGESAAQGIPDPGFGFAAQLQAQLSGSAGKSVQVFNLGITAINSHVVYQAAKQALAFEPDLLVVYMGNNEVVGPYGPGCTYLSASPPLWLIRSSTWVKGTRTGQLMGLVFSKFGGSGRKAVEWKGMETFSESAVRADDPKLEVAYRNFESNLSDILDMAAKAGVKVTLGTLVTNLTDSAPFISLHRPDLSTADEKAWKAAYDAGVIAQDLGDSDSAAGNLAESLRVDPEYADAQFRMGRLAQAAGERESARRYYLAALHWDALRFRPDSRINAIIRDLAARHSGSAVLVDAARLLGSDPESEAPPPGSELLFDHVHFSWRGNVEMGRLFAGASAGALFGAGEKSPAQLDGDAVAAAIGYTPYAHLAVLKEVVKLMIRPPFTSQITFSENQARLKREIEGVGKQLEDPQVQADCVAKVTRALALDPRNVAIIERLAEMQAASGDPASAYALLQRAAALEPMTAGLAVSEARALIALQRNDDAEALLIGSMDLDRQYFSPGTALVELWTRTQATEKGKNYFRAELARFPDNPYLRLEYATLLAHCGDPDGAEVQARIVWNREPEGRPAMAAVELIIGQYERAGRRDDADALALEAHARQPGDFFNNARVAQIYAKRGDNALTASALFDLSRSGPFDSGQHVDLAHRYADLGKGPEMLDQLAEARDLAAIEGNQAEERTVDGLIQAYRQRFGQGPQR